jgi:hypothetical protein
MRSLSLCWGVVLLAGCAKPEQQAAKDSASATMAAGAVAPISLASVAGKWSMQTKAANSDNVLVSYEMTASAEPTGWSFNFPNREPVPMRVVTDGDSIIADAGPYESVLRKGVQVSTHSVMRLQDGKLVGTTVAHYANAGADSVLNLRSEGTRAP